MRTRTDAILPPAPPADAGTLLPEAGAPVVRSATRRRNKICLRVIIIGALNFVLYTILYAAIGGDAHNGEIRVRSDEAGVTHTEYLVRGHFLHGVEGRAVEVARPVWIYSYLHSISVFLTSGAMILCMLVLARPHIIATMRDGLISGRAFVIAFGAIVVGITLAAVVLFAFDFVAQLSAV